MNWLKRTYDEPPPSDGERILVERLWPRGLERTQAAVNLWLKEVALNRTLRPRFGRDVHHDGALALKELIVRRKHGGST